MTAVQVRENRLVDLRLAFVSSVTPLAENTCRLSIFGFWMSSRFFVSAAFFVLAVFFVLGSVFIVLAVTYRCYIFDRYLKRFVICGSLFGGVIFGKMLLAFIFRRESVSVKWEFRNRNTEDFFRSVSHGALLAGRASRHRRRY